MTKNILIFYADIIDTVKRSLDIIGKRAVDDNGTTLFETITVSSREEPLLQDYIKSAVTTIVVELRKFVNAAYKNIGTNNFYQVYDFQGFLNLAVTIEQVGAADIPASASILFSNIQKMFLLKIGTKYYDTWAEGEQYNSGHASPPESNIYRFNNQLYRWNGTELATIDDNTEALAGLAVNLILADDYNEALDITLQQALHDYCAAYTLYSWFTVTSPRLAEKYLNDAIAQRSYFISLVFHRKTTPEIDLPNPLRTLTEP